MPNSQRQQFPTLRAWRHALGYSQQQAAIFLGLSQSFYSKLERRTSYVHGPAAKRLNDLTTVPIEELVGAV